jgi:hypothetical protein
MLKYKILIKLFVVYFVLTCCICEVITLEVASPCIQHLPRVLFFTSDCDNLIFICHF